MPVPMLDVNRQNQPLRHEIQSAIAEVCDSGAFVHGPACGQLEEALAEYCGAEHAVGCASGSDAILLALMALGIGPGDEVILPTFTFFATAGCVSRLGAKPVFADILPDTFNIDPADVERKITPATKAILPVHLFGQAADMSALGRLAADHGLAVVEDAAQAIGAEFEGRRVGSIGEFGCFSFYPTKNLGGFGDGGVVTTGDAELAKKLRVLRDHGQAPRYYHSVVGLNSRLDTIQAAVLLVKLGRLDEYAAARSRHALRYAPVIADLPGIVAPVCDARCPSVWNQYTVRVAGGHRDALQKHFAESGIGSAVYYPVPLHMQECFAELGYAEGDLPVAELAAKEVLSLPVYPELTADEQQEVIESISQFARSRASSSVAA